MKGNDTFKYQRKVRRKLGTLFDDISATLVSISK